VLKPAFHGDSQLYAYAIGVLLGTVVQLAMVLPMVARLGFRLQLAVDLRDPRIVQVLKLMLPVTIGLGVINFDLLINSSLGSLVSDQAPRAIDAAFRIYMLPQGVFSVALATVLFPALSRFASRGDRGGLSRTLANGMRQIFLLLVPAAACTLVLATPIVRLVYERGSFDAHSTELVATALFWFSFSLPFSGVNLLLTRAFFSLQRPWAPTALAAGNLAVNAAVSVALYRPLGIAGLVIGTAVASLGMTLGQVALLRRSLGDVEERATLTAFALMLIAAAAMGAVAYVTWWALDQTLGRALVGQLVSVGAGVAAGTAVYAGLVVLLGLREAEQIRALLTARRRRA
jgi:putative peptidoglycan lipid II flippase